VRLSPLGTSDINWPIVPAPDDRWWMWSSRWNENWQGKPKYSKKTFPSATLSTTNPIWPDLGSNPGRYGGKPATNRLNYGTASNQNLTPTLKMRAACYVWNRVHMRNMQKPSSPNVVSSLKCSRHCLTVNCLGGFPGDANCTLPRSGHIPSLLIILKTTRFIEKMYGI
jgi:hypothetical protein